MIIGELVRKWFGLEAIPCASCEVLLRQLDIANMERRELLHRLLDKPQTEPLSVPQEEFKPIKPAFVPWRVRQQMLEAEDRRAAELMRGKVKEIDALEKELGVSDGKDKNQAPRDSQAAQNYDTRHQNRQAES